MKFNKPSMEEFIYFIKEREKARLYKEGESKTNTKDEILLNNFFCNINRKHDKGTKKLLTIFNKIKDEKLKVMIAFMYRFSSSNPYILDEILNSNAFSKEEIVNIVNNMQVLCSPYHPYQSPFIAGKGAVKNIIKKIVPETIDTIYNTLKQSNSILSAIDLLLENWSRPLFGKNLNFHLTQCVLDCSYCMDNISENSDVPLGPGAKHGKKLLHNDISELYMQYPPHIVEHALCEYSKYYKIKYGGLKGRPRYKKKRI